MQGWGACVMGHVWPGRHVQPGAMHGWGCMARGDVRCRGTCVAGEMATAAGSTNTTGMHSCYVLKSGSEQGNT